MKISFVEKVEARINSIGVATRNENGSFKTLDEVLKNIASFWDDVPEDERNIFE